MTVTKKSLVLLGSMLLSVLGIIHPGATFAQTSMPREGGVLRLGTGRGITTLNPFVSTFSTNMNVRTLMYEPLVVFNENMEIVPRLAESWNISKDGRSFTFRLRKNVRFHHGSELTAEDVRWSIDYTLNPKNLAYGREFMKNVQSAEVIEPYVLRMDLRTPYAPFLSGLETIKRFLVVPKNSLKEAERPQAFPPGTGPYRFVEWKAGSHVKLKKFSQYWQQGMPHIDEVMIKTVGDGNVLFAAIRSGDLHIGDQMPINHALAVQRGEHEGLTIAISGPGGLRAYLFNVKTPPFDNVKVRRAIAYAIDKREILDGAHWGWGTIVNQLAEPESKWHFPIPEKRRDITRTKQLLREAGYPQGVTIKILGRHGNEDEVQVLQRQLLEAGIKLEFELLDSVAYMQRLRKREFGFRTTSGLIEVDQDLQLYGSFHTMGDRNHSEYSNPRVDRLLDEARVTKDPKKRYELYHEIVRIIDDEVPIIYGFLVPYVFIHRTELKNFKGPFDGRFFGIGNHGIPTAWLEE